VRAGAAHFQTLTFAHTFLETPLFTTTQQHSLAPTTTINPTPYQEIESTQSLRNWTTSTTPFVYVETDGPEVDKPEEDTSSIVDLTEHVGPTIKGNNFTFPDFFCKNDPESHHLLTPEGSTSHVHMLAFY
jgi:hypothetical protein